MDITYNKVDQTALPISQDRVSASEYNQIAASLMQIITSAGLTPDSQDNAQLLTALGPRIVETYSNGTSGYRVYSDGYCEQWGQINPNKSVGGGGYNKQVVTFLKPFANIYYVVNTNSFHDRFNSGINEKSTSSMTLYYVNDSSTTFTITSVGWFACGYIS